MPTNFCAKPNLMFCSAACCSSGLKLLFEVTAANCRRVSCTRELMPFFWRLLKFNARATCWNLAACALLRNASARRATAASFATAPRDELAEPAAFVAARIVRCANAAVAATLRIVMRAANLSFILVASQPESLTTGFNPGCWREYPIVPARRNNFSHQRMYQALVLNHESNRPLPS